MHAPKLTAQLSRLVGSGRGSPQAPKGLRHQSCSVVGPFAVVFGGETLAKGRDAVCNDLYIYDTSTSWEQGTGWHALAQSCVYVYMYKCARVCACMC